MTNVSQAYVGKRFATLILGRELVKDSILARLNHFLWLSHSPDVCRLKPNTVTSNLPDVPLRHRRTFKWPFYLTELFCYSSHKFLPVFFAIVYKDSVFVSEGIIQIIIELDIFENFDRLPMRLIIATNKSVYYY